MGRVVAERLSTYTGSSKETCYVIDKLSRSLNIVAYLIGKEVLQPLAVWPDQTAWETGGAQQQERQDW